MALLCEPDILIADEPTSVLDVTIQARILPLIRSLQRDFGTRVMLITHDLGVVAGMADRVIGTHVGRIVEAARPCTALRCHFPPRRADAIERSHRGCPAPRGLEDGQRRAACHLAS